MNAAIHILGAVALTLTAQHSFAAEPGRSGQAASPPISLAQLCAHKALSPQDQADCKRQAGEADSEAQKLAVRSTYEARAGLSAETAVGAGKAVDRAQQKIESGGSTAEPHPPRTRGEFPKPK